MEEKLLVKLMDMIKRDIWGVVLKKEVDGTEVQLSFKYDKEKALIVYQKSVNVNGKEEMSVTESSKTNEDVLGVIEDSLLVPEAIECVQHRISKENKFNALRVLMLERIETMGLSEEQRELMIYVINTTTQLNDYVGMGNRVYLVSTPDFWEHVRVTDNSRWSDTGYELHLQLVQAMEDPDGVKHHNYPDMTFEALVGRILNSPLLNKEKTPGKNV